MRKKIKKLKIVSILLPLAAVCFSHQVFAVSCTGGTVTAANSTNTPIGYSSCIGSISGNDVGNKGTLLADLSSGVAFNEAGDWSQFMGDIVIPNEVNKGTWSVNGLTSDTFVVSIKTNTNYSAYFFENIGFTATGGTFNTYGIDTNGKGNNSFANISHMNIFERVSAVPIPGAVLLFGSAILALFGFSLKNRSKKTAV